MRRAAAVVLAIALAFTAAWLAQRSASASRTGKALPAAANPIVATETATASESALDGDETAALARRETRRREQRPTVEQRLSQQRLFLGTGGSDEQSMPGGTGASSDDVQPPAAAPDHAKTPVGRANTIRPSDMRAPPECEIVRDGVIIYKPGRVLGNPLDERDFPDGKITIANVSGSTYSVRFVGSGRASIYGRNVTPGERVQVDDFIDITLHGAMQMEIVPLPGSDFSPEPPQSAG